MRPHIYSNYLNRQRIRKKGTEKECSGSSSSSRMQALILIQEGCYCFRWLIVTSS